MDLKQATFRADGQTLKVTAPVETIEHTYDISFLYSQREQIQKSLEEVNALIEQAEGLGISIEAEPLSALSINE